jgi:hypothetical protein
LRSALPSPEESLIQIQENFMKLHRITLCAALLLAAAVAFAQTKEGDVTADVPFAFVAAGHPMPAGHYIVSHLNDSLRLHDRQNQGMFIPTHSAQRSGHVDVSKLVFHRYGDTYFLSEVWTGGNDYGRALFPTKAERELGERGAEREIAEVRASK